MPLPSNKMILIRNLIVEEISLVDKPAIRRKYLLIKRAKNKENCACVKLFSKRGEVPGAGQEKILELRLDKRHVFGREFCIKSIEGGK